MIMCDYCGRFDKFNINGCNGCRAPLKEPIKPTPINYNKTIQLASCGGGGTGGSGGISVVSGGGGGGSGEVIYGFDPDEPIIKGTIVYNHNLRRY